MTDEEVKFDQEVQKAKSLLLETLLLNQINGNVGLAALGSMIGGVLLQFPNVDDALKILDVLKQNLIDLYEDQKAKKSEC